MEDRIWTTSSVGGGLGENLPAGLGGDGDPAGGLAGGLGGLAGGLGENLPVGLGSDLVGGLTGGLGSLAGGLGGLTDGLDLGGLGGVGGQLADLTGQLDGLQAAVEDLTGRVEDLEQPSQGADTDPDLAGGPDPAGDEQPVVLPAGGDRPTEFDGSGDGDRPDMGGFANPQTWMGAALASNDHRGLDVQSGGWRPMPVTYGPPQTPDQPQAWQPGTWLGADPAAGMSGYLTELTRAVMTAAHTSHGFPPARLPGPTGGPAAALAGGHSGPGGPGGPGGGWRGDTPITGHTQPPTPLTGSGADLDGTHAATAHQDRMDWLAAAHGFHDPQATTGSSTDPTSGPTGSGEQAWLTGNGMAVPTRDGGTLTLTPTTTSPHHQVAPDLAKGRYLINIDNDQAPGSYDFALDMPTGAHAVTNPTGGVDVIGADGQNLQTITAPWARDATGADLPTRFEVVQSPDGSTTLRQHVAFDENTAFPVLADPAAGGAGGAAAGAAAGGAVGAAAGGAATGAAAGGAIGGAVGIGGAGGAFGPAVGAGAPALGAASPVVASSPGAAPGAAPAVGAVPGAPAASPVLAAPAASPVAAPIGAPATPGAPAVGAVPGAPAASPVLAAPAASPVFATGATPSSGVLGATPTSGVLGATPTSGVLGATPTSGVLGATPTSGVLGATPTSGVLGATPTSGLPGATPTPVVVPASLPVLGTPVPGSPVPGAPAIGGVAPPGVPAPPGPGADGGWFNSLVGNATTPQTAPDPSGLSMLPAAGAPSSLVVSVPAGSPQSVVVDAGGRPFTCACNHTPITLLPAGHPGTPGNPARPSLLGLLPGTTLNVRPDVAGPATPDAPSWVTGLQNIITSRTVPVGADGKLLPPADSPVQQLPSDGIVRGDGQNVIVINAGPKLLVRGTGNQVLGPVGNGRNVQAGGELNSIRLDGSDDNYAAAYGDSSTVALGRGHRNDGVVADGDHGLVMIDHGDDNNATAGRGSFNVAYVGNGARSRAVTGQGSYNTALAGRGRGNAAIAGGPGDGLRAVVGDGDLGRAIVGEGAGNYAFAGHGNGNFTRTGPGDGNGTVMGEGVGNLTQVGPGKGNTANGFSVAPENSRPFTPRPGPPEHLGPLLPHADDPFGQVSPFGPPADGATPLFPAIRSTVSLAQGFIGKFDAEKAVLQDAATRHLFTYDRLTTEATALRATGDPAVANRAAQLDARAERSLGRAQRYSGMSQRLEQITGQRLDSMILRHGFQREFRTVPDASGKLVGRQLGPMLFNQGGLHGYMPKGLRKAMGRSLSDGINRGPTNPLISENPSVLQHRETVQVNPEMKQVGGLGETTRRVLGKVGGPVGIVLGGADVAYQINNGRSPEYAVGKTGSEIAVGGATGGLATAGIAALFPGPGWAVAGGIIIGTGVGMLWSYLGGSEWAGGLADSIGGDDPPPARKPDR